MKKVLAVFMAILMAFSAVSLVAFAEDSEPADTETTTEAADDSPRYPEDTGIRNIMNSDGLVFPINFDQLKMSVVFKIIERIINFFLGLIGILKLL